jgi:hypothetical protein
MSHGSDQDASLRSMISNGGSECYRPWIWRDYGNIQVADLSFIITGTIASIFAYHTLLSLVTFLYILTFVWCTNSVNCYSILVLCERRKMRDRIVKHIV